MDFGIPTKLSSERDINSKNSFESIRNWKYKKIKVISNKAKENSAFYVSEVKKLQKRNEKNTGIEFILDKNSTYGDFASLINDMAIARHETYGLDIEKTGHFFVPVIYKDPNAKVFKYECLLCNDNLTDYRDPTVMDKISDFINGEYYKTFFQNISKLPKGAFIIIFGFLLFLNISMLSIKERFQLSLK
ncbi:hypothetical protein [Chryseobacterium sp. G0201]|uniref:hypothetical protein n=1 Tax=Chryseobacterium sp. G0201 TaxID=2487065 RepID=UPI001E2C8C5E|nr:hypothetical protein [Chryseobacterium sp. G0201]